MCGTVMLRKAANYSASLGWEGIFGLHSLSSTIEYYRRRIGMTALGTDCENQNLMYFETTADQSKQFLNQGD